MTKYPTPGEYQEAVQFPASAFTDPELQQAEPETQLFGLPQVITGAFAAVFPLRGAGRRWAVKCFLSDVPDQQARYRAIARGLEAAGLPYTVGFDYQPEGIRVSGAAFPLLKMEWVEGAPLNRFVAEHLHAPDVLAALAGRWVELLRDLQAAGIAHGDLQHGNVLVTASESGPRLRLVDYDTLFVPALRGRRSPEVGHRNYQHPDRNETDFGPYLDHFSGLVVYVALRACALRPELWERYDTGENLLFRAPDFFAPERSPLFGELAVLEPLRGPLDALQTACFLEPGAVPSLPDVLDGRGRLPARRSLLKGRPRRAPAARRSTAERLFLPLVLVGVGLAGLCLAAGAPALAAAVGTVLLGGALAGAAYLYQGLAPVRRRRRLKQEAAFFDRLLAGLAEQIDALERERTRELDRAGDRHARRLQELREEALERRLKHHFIGEASAFDGISHKVVVRLKASGIRTAYQATPDRLQQVSELSEGSRTQVARWREALVSKYRDDLPGTLSPAEVRRLERALELRLTALHADVERTREKLRVQEAERDEILARRRETPEVSFGRYLGYLLRVRSLPAEAPPSRPAAPPPGAARAPLPPPVEEDRRPWWEQHA